MQPTSLSSELKSNRAGRSRRYQATAIGLSLGIAAVAFFVFKKTATSDTLPAIQRLIGEKRYEEVAARSGLAYRYEAGATPNLFLPDTMGGGVGLIDYDPVCLVPELIHSVCAAPYVHLRT